MVKNKIFCVVGTRPDAIKTAPVVLELRRFPEVETLLVATGQHREMLSQALEAFDLKPEVDLKIMSEVQSLTDITTRALTGIDSAIREHRPAMVVAQGDTTSTFAAGLASFYHKIPFAHVEAGLRTPTIWDPFPEEYNRRAVALFAQLNFAPTEQAAKNLLEERILPETIHITGNTGIDAVQMIAKKVPQTWYEDDTSRIILLTTHRRENWGERQADIAQAAKTIVERFRDVKVVLPMHRNESVRSTMRNVLGGCDRVDLIEPPDYPQFVKLMERATIIWTDSGGVQEEAPTFGKPVLVLRETTERPEGVLAGNAELVGTNVERIVERASRLLQDCREYESMANAASPYGDGHAAARIRFQILKAMGIESPPEPEWK